MCYDESFLMSPRGSHWAKKLLGIFFFQLLTQHEAYFK